MLRHRFLKFDKVGRGGISVLRLASTPRVAILTNIIWIESSVTAGFVKFCSRTLYCLSVPSGGGEGVGQLPSSLSEEPVASMPFSLLAKLHHGALLLRRQCSL